MRRHGEAPRPGLVYRDRAGAYGVLLRDGMALLAEQEGDFLLPGGGVDPGETPAQALHREVYEETGWRISTPRRLGLFARYAWLEEERFHARKIQHLFLARPIRPLGPPVEPDHRPVWVRAFHAPDLLSVEGEAVAMAEALRAGHGR
jgi:8-oxo-dGTP diphosphatase